MNILFTCAGRRHYLIEYFKKELDGVGKVVAADMQRSAPAMASADVAYMVPEVYDQKYIATLLEICIRENINALFSLNDLELPILAEHRGKFESLGVFLMVSSPFVIDTCFDKRKSNVFASSIGLNIPLTYSSLDEAKVALRNGELSFPLVVKPRWGSASIGIEFPMTVEELELDIRLLRLKLERSILLKASSSDIDNAIIIQKKIGGKEFGLDILNDLLGNQIAVYVKEKLAMRAGETDKSALIDLPEVEKIGVTIGTHLKHIGNLDCDIMEEDGIFYFLEMNPRFGGGYPFTHMCGGNFPSAIITWLSGNLVKDSFFKKEYGKIYSKCDILIPVN